MLRILSMPRTTSTIRSSRPWAIPSVASPASSPSSTTSSIPIHFWVLMKDISGLHRTIVVIRIRRWTTIIHIMPAITMKWRAISSPILIPLTKVFSTPPLCLIKQLSIPHGTVSIELPVSCVSVIHEFSVSTIHICNKLFVCWSIISLPHEFIILSISRKFSIPTLSIFAYISSRSTNFGSTWTFISSLFSTTPLSTSPVLVFVTLISAALFST
mmetsp:Transcript_14597/g.27446  ORF Transcript_14597/g.27446 Transcript_14597/m.27446 type:complete len:214 (-) Transcript_14597:2065-2706(-)